MADVRQRLARSLGEPFRQISVLYNITVRPPEANISRYSWARPRSVSWDLGERGSLPLRVYGYTKDTLASTIYVTVLGIVVTARCARLQSGQAPCFLTKTVRRFCSSVWKRGLLFTCFMSLLLNIRTLGPGPARLFDPSFTLRRFLGLDTATASTGGCQQSVRGSRYIKAGTGERGWITGPFTSAPHD